MIKNILLTTRFPVDRKLSNSAFGIELIKHISEDVPIQVIASSGAGKVEHFAEFFG
jgi:glutamine amidotransferase/cyclase